MITLERLDEGSALSRRGDPGPATSPTEEAAIAQRIRTAGASPFWSRRLLPRPRRNAMQALYLFCREVRDIADGNASRTLKLALLADWRTQIALLYAGRPQHVVTRALHDPIERFDLRSEDFLASSTA
jgi:phytoene synthase